jgi:hypothetical protein
MKFNIPSVGYKFLVKQDWAIALYDEYRNSVAHKWLGVKPLVGSNGYRIINSSVPVVIPEGTLLSVDRIYIRKGKDDYDSITFRVLGVKGYGVVRFWVKLDELNNLEYTPWEEQE